MMSAEEQLTKYSNRITRNSTVLLMIAVVAYFITLFFGFFPTTDPVSGDAVANAYFLGIPDNAFGVSFPNFLTFDGLVAQVLAMLMTFLAAIYRLCAGLSFAAVCFDESKNIWFRVVSVAALMLIIFGGLRLM